MYTEDTSASMDTLTGLMLAVDDFVKHVDHDLEVAEDVSHRSVTVIDV